MRRNHRQNSNQSPFISGMVGIFMVCFGIFWTVMASQLSPIMAIFGIMWTIIAASITVNNIRSAKGKTEKETLDKDPFEAAEKEPPRDTYSPKELRCPYCGAPIGSGDRKCEYCDSEF